MVEDCCCDYETVDSINEEVLHPSLQELVKLPFFRYFKVRIVDFFYKKKFNAFISDVGTLLEMCVVILQWGARVVRIWIQACLIGELGA